MTMNHQAETTDVIIIGGGLAGLTAATYLGKAGLKVLLLEKAQRVGGRARTRAKGEFLFNMGAHALYKDGEGVSILRELGVSFSGGQPSVGGYAVLNGQKHLLPVGPLSMLKTSALSLRGKLEIGKVFMMLPRIDTEARKQLTLQQWLDETIKHAEVQAFLRAFFRLSSYANAPQEQSAGAAIKQLQMAVTGNVYYLDGGWQTLVNGLEQAAEQAGVSIKSGESITAIERDELVRGVRLADNRFYAAKAVIIATSPAIAAKLLPEAPLTRWAENATPITAACLDVALDALPDPKVTFGLGIDKPLYLSVHSATANLAPEGKVLIHLLKYQSTPSNNPQQDEQELEVMLDLLQPGWRKQLIERRFLPKMIVSNAVVSAAQGGLPGRPDPSVAGIANLFVAGDWVGKRGQLADASFASAKEAAIRCKALLTEG